MNSAPGHDVHKTKAFGDYFKYYLAQEAIGRQDLEQVYWNALFAGRYDYLVNLNGRSSWARHKECIAPNATSIIDPVSRIIKEAENHRVLAFNESHTQLQQRFFLLQNLEIFWNAGYRHLGYEAYQAGDVGVDYESSNHAGFYFDEPVMAATLRKARLLGFQVFGYENNEPILRDADWAESINFREAGQAKRLATHISKLPENEKVLVWAGGHHITKNDNQSIEGRVLTWMAARLKRDYDLKIYSVDLTSCQFLADNETAALRGYQIEHRKWWVSELFQQWGVDAQIQLPLVSEGKITTELYRKYLGEEISVPAEMRSLASSIFVQAFGEKQKETTTAFDSILMLEGENHPLYLPSGQFKLVAYSSDGVRLGETFVSVN